MLGPVVYIFKYFICPGFPAKIELRFTFNRLHPSCVWKKEGNTERDSVSNVCHVAEIQCWFKVERKDADNITTELMLAINVKMKNSSGR